MGGRVEAGTRLASGRSGPCVVCKARAAKVRVPEPPSLLAAEIDCIVTEDGTVTGRRGSVLLSDLSDVELDRLAALWIERLFAKAREAANG